MTKSIFKASYSEYRRKLSKAYSFGGKEGFSLALNSSMFFIQITEKPRPINMRMLNLKHGLGIN